MSTKHWVDELRMKSSILFFHCYTNDAEMGLDENTFALGVMTPFQQQHYVKHARLFVCLDSTHNITHYKFLLYTIIVRDALILQYRLHIALHRMNMEVVNDGNFEKKKNTVPYLEARLRKNE